MHAHRVLVAKRLADGIDAHQRDVRGVERVDARVRRGAGVRRLADEAHRLAEPAVVGARDCDRAVFGTRRRVDHHGEIDVVEVAQAQQLALAAEELEASGSHLLESPLEVAAFLGGDGEEGHASRQVLHRLRRREADGGAEHPRHLSVVTAGVRRACGRVGFRVALNDEAIELAHHRERRAGAGATGDVGAHAGESEAGLRRQPDFAKHVGDQRRGLDFLEAELGLAADALAERDDALGVRLDGRVHPLLELVPRHAGAINASCSGSRRTARASRRRPTRP